LHIPKRESPVKLEKNVSSARGEMLPKVEQGSANAGSSKNATAKPSRDADLVAFWDWNAFSMRESKLVVNTRDPLRIAHARKQ
jgi:hypothetical protein